jgi:hypothetical protein
VRKRIFLLGIAGLFILGISGCSKNKFSLTRSEPTDIPYYNVANDSCYVCHSDSSLRKTIGTETVPLYVDREKFARSIHRANRCLDCHTDIVFYKGHSEAVKTYGGWANFSTEDTSQTRNYHTSASISCGNCHTNQSGFFSSQHYLIEDIKQSRQETHNGVKIGKDYDEAKCGKCHLTCATCHFKGEIQRSASGEVTDFWSQLLNGIQISEADSLTNWWFDWTTNVEAHDFATGEELENSDDLCRICHTGFYSNYNQTGYYHPDDLSSWESLVSQGIEKYPQYEERRFLQGDIMVSTGIPFLDSLYATVADKAVMKDYKCLYCHDRVHSLKPITCNNCHSVSFNKFGYTFAPHLDVACVACHDATMNVWRVNYSKYPPADTVRVAAVKDNKVVDWHSHMIIEPDGENTNFCERRCHNPVTGPTIGAPWTESHFGNIHSDD